MEKFQYKKAICREIPKSLVASALRMDNSEHVDYEKAVKEHSIYVKTLKDLGLQVTVLPAIESLPDCVFVEDPAIVIGNKALIANLGHQNRKGEAASIMQALKDLNIEVSVMHDPATVDGGDVLFTGREIFIGISSRSNKEGVNVLQQTFPEYPVHGIKIEQALHLKSMMSMCDQNTLLVGESKHAESALNELMQKSQYTYKVLRVPDDSAANCLLINGTIVYRAKSEFPESAKILQEHHLPGIEITASELSKVDGALTCCSLLLQ